jgi:hypothetical protein
MQAARQAQALRLFLARRRQLEAVMLELVCSGWFIPSLKGRNGTGAEMKEAKDISRVKRREYRGK